MPEQENALAPVEENWYPSSDVLFTPTFSRNCCILSAGRKSRLCGCATVSATPSLSFRSDSKPTTNSAATSDSAGGTHHRTRGSIQFGIVSTLECQRISSASQRAGNALPIGFRYAAGGRKNAAARRRITEFTPAKNYIGSRTSGGFSKPDDADIGNRSGLPQRIPTEQ